MGRPLVVPNPKITMEFDCGAQGWTESHFYTSAVPLTSQQLVADTIALCKARTLALDGTVAQLVACRLSLDNVNRDADHIDPTDIPNPNKTSGGYSGGPGTTSKPWTYTGPHAAWPVQLSTENATTNPIEYVTIGSVPPDQAGNGALDAAGQNVAYFVRKYLAVLCAGKWGALYRNWPAPAVVSFPVGSETFNPAAGQNPSQIAFSLAAPFPVASTFPPGAFVRLQGCTYQSAQKRLRLNGTYQVGNYNATTGVLTVNVPRLIVGPTFMLPGYLQLATAGVTPYTKGVIRNLTHRKRGRPLDASRGRR